MNTEDDTFDILKRIPFKDMREHYRNLNDATWNRMTDDECDKFFEQFGWTESEFRISWNKNQ